MVSLDDVGEIGPGDGFLARDVGQVVVGGVKPGELGGSSCVAEGGVFDGIESLVGAQRLCHGRWDAWDLGRGLGEQGGDAVGGWWLNGGSNWCWWWCFGQKGFKEERFY